MFIIVPVCLFVCGLRNSLFHISFHTLHICTGLTHWFRSASLNDYGFPMMDSTEKEIRDLLFAAGEGSSFPLNLGGELVGDDEAEGGVEGLSGGEVSIGGELWGIWVLFKDLYPSRSSVKTDLSVEGTK